MGATEDSETDGREEMEERISGVEDTIEEIGSLVKENIKSSKFLSQNIQVFKMIELELFLDSGSDCTGV